MPILNSPATLADFQALDWEAAISRATGRTCDSFYVPFCGLIEKAEQISPAAAACARMLVCICGLHLHADNLHEPFQPTLAVAALGEDDLTFLRSIESVIGNAELRARIQDLIWLRGRAFPSARAAIESYIESAEAMYESDGIAATDRIERAMRLALSLKQTDQLQKIATLIRRHLIEEQPQLNFIAARLAERLLETGWQDAASVVVRCHELAERAANDGNFLLRRRLLELAAAWCERANDPEKRRELLVQHAESYVVEAELLAKKENISFGQPAHLIECAITAFRKLPDAKQRIESLFRLRDQYNSRFISQMVPLSEELKLHELHERARQHVTNDDVHSAILALAFISKSQSVVQLRNEVAKSNERYLSRQIFGTTMFGATGRTAGRAAPHATNGSESSPAFLDVMFRQAALGRIVTVKGLIEPARLHLADQHHIRAEDVVPFVWNNPMVPMGREPLFLEGLVAGFRGNHVISNHILIPQVEHLIRSLLYAHGKRTSTYSTSGIEKENDLNTTLVDPGLNKILGEDLVFDLRGLLVEPFGSNLRNEMAHGMREYGGFFTVESVYCWWLTLHLLCLPLTGVIRESNEGGTSGTTPS